ncbi:hypothetical protein GCM10010233_22300 [Streptomyces pseudogriseolus]|uniref:Uncharacterized protein n=1 Tax=Streptomyces pseudogriseolus TaxID=36817 RepID=A0ABQ2ST14_STREZ|nr:hypothetical protein GCM10010233_22300 [Streptomyces gancidicus]GGS39523.1 hypothetical protein GCM10010285_18060 [Streptomyces rubiginosus]
MCNCTIPHAPPPPLRADPTGALRLRQARAQKAVEAGPTRARTHHRRTKKIAPDSAESGAIDDAPGVQSAVRL